MNIKLQTAALEVAVLVEAKLRLTETPAVAAEKATKVAEGLYALLARIEAKERLLAQLDENMHPNRNW